jgi:hypothetical protein
MGVEIEKAMGELKDTVLWHGARQRLTRFLSTY